jgi:hypothetical protein
MKKIFILIGLLGLSFSGQAQVTVFEEASTQLADELGKTIRKTRDFPDNAKIAVCVFLGYNEETDTLKATLGLRLSKKVHQSLAYSFRNKDYKCMFPDNPDGDDLAESMANYYTPPKTAEERDKFWKNMLDENVPDFFLTGKYRLVNNKLIIRSVFLHHNKFNDGLNFRKDLALNEDILVDVPSGEIKTLQKLNYPINNISEVFSELVRFKGTGNFLDFNILHFPDDKKPGIALKDDDFMIIDHKYQLAMDLNQQLYVYLLSFDAADKKHPYFYLIHPYEIENFHKEGPGLVTIPREATFSPTPPEGNVLFKIIASPVEIPLKYDKYKTDKNSYEIYLKESNCRAFLDELKGVPADKIATKSIVKTIIKN